MTTPSSPPSGPSTGASSSTTCWPVTSPDCTCCAGSWRPLCSKPWQESTARQRQRWRPNIGPKSRHHTGRAPALRRVSNAAAGNHWSHGSAASHSTGNDRQRSPTDNRSGSTIRTGSSSNGSSRTPARFASGQAMFRSTTSASSKISGHPGRSSPSGPRPWRTGGAKPSWSAPPATTTSTPGSQPTAHAVVTGEPDDRETVRRLTRRWIVPAGGRGSGGGDLGAARLTWTGNREGTTAWRGSAERSGDAEGVAVQGPRDMAKARLLESQSPVVETSHLPTRRLRSGPPASDGSDFRHPNLPAGGRRAASPFKGTDRDAYVTLDTSGAQRNSGWPTGREPYGHGGSVVVAGVTPCQGGRESRLHGRRDPGAHDRRRR